MARYSGAIERGCQSSSSEESMDTYRTVHWVYPESVQKRTLSKCSVNMALIVGEEKYINVIF